jgi:hypothetical protein
MQRQSGISLSEVLIGLALASLIMSMLMQFYLSSKRQYLEAEEILSRNFDVHWVGELLSDSIRRAGFTPCVSIEQLTLEDRRPKRAVIRTLAIDNHFPQSIYINRMSEHFSQVLRVQSSAQLVVSSTASFKEKRAVMIADCEHAEVQQVVAAEAFSGGTLLTLARPLLFSYSTSAYVGEFLEERWFIKKNNRDKDALYYRATQTEELSSLIHSLQIHLQKVHGRSFVEVNMGLAEGKSLKLMVAVRGL